MNWTNLSIIVLSYLLGSIPFGYIITRLTTQQNILKIGWRKTSGSNVFKNIGKWQGVATGILDVAKGYAAVRIAQRFNLPPSLQALAGAAAVVGHNWSFFLKLAGGRGIGTFVGAALALSPKIIGFSLILPVLMALTWNAAEATILLLILFLVLSAHFNKFSPVGTFGILCLAPIFLKRLSPLTELMARNAKSKKHIFKTEIIKNRLVFDDDKPYKEPRIKKVVRCLTKS